MQNHTLNPTGKKNRNESFTFLTPYYNFHPNFFLFQDHPESRRKYLLPLFQCTIQTRHPVLVVHPISLPADIISNYPIVSLDYCSLFSYLKRTNLTLNEHQAHYIFNQLLNICVKLKGNCNIFPLQAKNIFIHPHTLTVRLIIVPKKTNHPLYDSPELYKSHYPRNRSTWNLGILLFLMLYKKKPFGSLHRLIHSPVLLKKPNHLSLEVLLFLGWCLTKHPKHRITLHQCLHHPWITKRML